MAIRKEIGIVLKNKNFKESDKLVTIFGRTSGKFTAIATGAQRPMVRKTGNLETGSLIKLALAEGKSLDIITEVETVSYPDISKDNHKHILYITEVTDKFLPDLDPEPNIFKMLSSTISMIRSTEDNIYLLNTFHISLLKEMGYFPSVPETNLPAKTLAVLSNYSSLKKRLSKENNKKIFKIVTSLSENRLGMYIRSKDLFSD